MTPPHLIQRVKDSTDLVSLVSEYVVLKKQGTRWVGLCCFHREDTPSFGVNIEGFYKCFGCGAGGDVFTFLERIEGISFHEALKRLASAAGISLDERPVSRVAMAYAREEAALCKWFWERRRARVMEQVYSAMDDEEMAEILAMPLRAWEGLSVPERFAFFRAHVTEQDRAAWRAEVASGREFAENWLALAEFAK